MNENFSYGSLILLFTMIPVFNPIGSTQMHKGSFEKLKISLRKMLSQKWQISSRSMSSSALQNKLTVSSEMAPRKHKSQSSTLETWLTRWAHTQAQAPSACYNDSSSQKVHSPSSTELSGESTSQATLGPSPAEPNSKKPTLKTSTNASSSTPKASSPAQSFKSKPAKTSMTA